MSQQQVPTINRRQRRSYDAARREKKDVETEIEVAGEVFITHPGRIPGAILVDFMKLGVYQDSEAMWDFFRCALDTEPPKDEDDKPTGPSDFERFHDLVRSPDVVIEAETLSQIIGDIVEDGSGFPTPPPAR